MRVVGFNLSACCGPNLDQEPCICFPQGRTFLRGKSIQTEIVVGIGWVPLHNLSIEEWNFQGLLSDESVP